MRNWHAKTICRACRQSSLSWYNLLVYLPADVLIEPDDIEASPRIKVTLQIHMIKWFFDEQFFKMAADGKPFFTQFYGEGRYLLCFSVFLSDYFFDFLEFHVGRKKISVVISPPNKNKSIYVSFKFQGKYITYFVATFTGWNINSFFDVFFFRPTYFCPTYCSISIVL